MSLPGWTKNTRIVENKGENMKESRENIRQT